MIVLKGIKNIIQELEELQLQPTMKNTLKNWKNAGKGYSMVNSRMKDKSLKEEDIYNI